MKSYNHILHAFCSSTWAILPEKFEAIRQLIDLKARGGTLSEADLVQFRALSRPSPRTAGYTAVIPIFGTISYRGTMLLQASGATSVQQITKAFRAALADDTVKAIIFDVDSPGGEVDGVEELANEIFNARGQKRSVAVANTLAASAAYWLAASAGELVASPSAMVGGIGVFTVHQDQSKLNDMIGINPTYVSAGKYKVEGNPDQPLDDDARAAMQRNVDGYYNAFVSAVARGRGVTTTEVRDGFGQGRVVLARDAVRMDMVDRVATLDQTIARFGSGHVQGANQASRELPGLAMRRRQMQMAERLTGDVPSDRVPLSTRERQVQIAEQEVKEFRHRG